MTDLQNVQVFNYNNNAVLFLLLAFTLTIFNFILQLINNQSYFTSKSTYGPYYLVSSSSSIQILFIFSAFFMIDKLYQKSGPTLDNDGNPISQDDNSANYAFTISFVLIFISCGLLIYNLYTNYS